VGDSELVERDGCGYMPVQLHVGVRYSLHELIILTIMQLPKAPEFFTKVPPTVSEDPLAEGAAREFRR
jgi:hypothetical protein